MRATATEQTPIMLSCHHYWNFEAYQETQTLDGHFAQFPAHQVIGTDGILIPDGSLINVTGTPLDFRTAKSIGAAINQTTGLDYCGTGGFCVPAMNNVIVDVDNGGFQAAMVSTTAGSTTTTLQIAQSSHSGASTLVFGESSFAKEDLPVLLIIYAQAGRYDQSSRSSDVYLRRYLQRQSSHPSESRTRRSFDLLPGSFVSRGGAGILD